MEQKQREYLARLATEQVNSASLSLDELGGEGIARLMNMIDEQVAKAVAQAVPQIGAAIEAIAMRLEAGGRLFYVGAGTSGRLGVLDASECPPTFGVSSELVQGIIAGGDTALRYAVEGAEDNREAGKDDLVCRALCEKDAVVAISASGFAAYCQGALAYANHVGALSVSLCCNQGAALSREAQIAIEAPTGPEALSGSTRLKAGTATKMILNMLSTGAMVLLGKTYGNLMVDMCSTNAKLKDRSIRIMMHALGLVREEAEAALQEGQGSIKAAIVMRKAQASLEHAQAALAQTGGRVRKAIQLLQL